MFINVDGVCRPYTNSLQTVRRKPKFVGLLCEHKRIFAYSVDGFLSMIHVCELYVCSLTAGQNVHSAFVKTVVCYVLPPCGGKLVK